MQPTPVDLRTLAMDVATAAGDVAMGLWDRRADWASKSTPTDPVTEADHASEALVVARLTAARPDDGLVGEEGVGDRSGTSGLRWVVDPLDGTVNFTYGIARWSVSIAVLDDHGPVAGVVHAPASGETFVASRGGGATRNGAPIAVTDVADPAMTMVGTGFFYDVAVRAVQGREVADLLTRARDVRRQGSAALDLADVACGRLDGFTEFGLNTWDWSAGELLVTEAGGEVSRFERTIAGWTRDVVVAGGPAAHAWLAAWSRDVAARDGAARVATG